MSERVVVVTGASAGVGRATALAFARQGASVGAIARGEERLEATRHELEKAGVRAETVAADVAEADAVEDAAARIESALGPIDVWVNNAMVTVFAPLERTEPDEFRRATEVTYLGSVWGTMAALRRMKPRDRGVIVQVGSALAYRGIPLQAAYCGAKHALQGFLESVRTELRHDGSNVRLTMVQLPAVNTPQFTWSRVKMPHQPQPVPPIFQPEVAADAIVFAANHPRREVMVGWPTVKAILSNAVAPGVADRYLADNGYQAQQTDVPLEHDRPGNLFEPADGDRGAHGRSTTARSGSRSSSGRPRTAELGRTISDAPPADDSEVDRWVRGLPMTFRRLLMHLSGSLWFVPVLCVIAGAAISFGTIALDRLFDYGAISSDVVGDPNAARSILSTVAVSMVSLTALVLTITMVVVQLAMGQFSPRIVQRILRDKPSQFAIGLFVATFVHSILALREVSGHVPGIAVATAYLLVLASIVVLVIYVQHIGQALRVSALVELVGHDTRGLVDKLYPDSGSSAPAQDETVVRARQSGVITAIGYEKLVAQARRSRCILELIPALGDFVPANAPLFLVHDNGLQLNEDDLHQALVFKLEPTLDRDVRYGLRMLVDIAERSLSESPFQDPTTAVQAIDRIHDILRQLARRPFPDGVYRDESGEMRLVVPTPTWDDYVLLATEEITLAGAGSPPVARRLEAALIDLHSVALPDRKPILDRRLQALAAAVSKADLDSTPVLSAR